GFHQELVVTAGFVEADAASYQYLHAVGGLETQQHAAVAEQGAAHLRLCVLEGEVQMAGAGLGQVGDLAFYPQYGEAALQEAAGGAVQLRDAEDAARGD